MPIMLEILLLFFAFQLALDGLPLALLIYAIVTYRRNPSTARALIILAFVPVAYFVIAYITERVLPPILRDAEVASWPRKPVTPQNRPQALVTTAGWWVAKTLVGGGPFVKAYAWTSDGWYVYERSSNPDCPSPSELKQYISDRDRLKSTPCAVAAKSDEPRSQEPHLRLFHDEHAPSRHRPSEGVVSGTTLELRWSPDAGGDLIAFWEIPYFNAPVIPPLLGRNGLARYGFAPRRYDQRPDPRTFVLDAIGFRN